MKRRILYAAVTLLALVLFVSRSRAQSDNVYWHISPDVKSCSMVIDPSLTQEQWHTFTKQVGAISSFKSLASASTLGAMNFRVAIDYGRTPVDQHDPAWINTFTHPDADCPLGDAVTYPALRVGMGLTDQMDIGAYGTVAPGANYGMLGGEVKYAFLRETERSPAAAVRASATFLTGVPDFDLNIYSVEALTSKTFGRFSPYVGVRTSLAVGKETTSKVDLKTETIPVVQGYAGVSVNVWVLSIATEYNISAVNTLALAIGVAF